MNEQNQQNTQTPAGAYVEQPTTPIQTTRKSRRRRLAAW